MFVAPTPLRTEYSGKFYHNMLLNKLLEDSICNKAIIELQQEVEKEALGKAVEYSILQRAEWGVIPRPMTPEDRSRLCQLGAEIAENVKISKGRPLESLHGDYIIAFLEKHSIKKYDWPTPKYPQPWM